MWMVEDLTVPKFREMVGAQMGGVTLRTGVEEKVSRLVPSSPTAQLAPS